jgi:Na+/proline symporter
MAKRSDITLQATAAVLTYDLYQAYIRPTATGKELVHFSHYIVVGFAILCAGIAAGLNHAGFNVSCKFPLPFLPPKS